MKSKCWGLCLVLCWVSGCGGAAKDSPTLGEASGIVLLDKQPLPHATITFYPEKGPPAVGHSDETGAFRMTLNGANGACVGPNQVTVSVTNGPYVPPPMDGNEMKQLPKSVLPKKYGSVESTDIMINIPKEGRKDLTIELAK